LPLYLHRVTGVKRLLLEMVWIKYNTLRRCYVVQVKQDE
jgi:hypothetical protein